MTEFDEAMQPADLNEFTPEGNTARIEAIVTVSNKYGRSIMQTGKLLAERKVIDKDGAYRELQKVKIGD